MSFFYKLNFYALPVFTNDNNTTQFEHEPHTNGVTTVANRWYTCWPLNNAIFFLIFKNRRKTNNDKRNSFWLKPILIWNSNSNGNSNHRSQSIDFFWMKKKMYVIYRFGKWFVIRNIKRLYDNKIQTHDHLSCLVLIWHLRELTFRNLALQCGHLCGRTCVCMRLCCFR